MEGKTTALTGKDIPMRADCICVRSDTPDAVGIARVIRHRIQSRALERPGPIHHVRQDRHTQPRDHHVSDRLHRETCPDSAAATKNRKWRRETLMSVQIPVVTPQVRLRKSRPLVAKLPAPVPAVALATHRRQHALPGQRMRERVASVLAPAAEWNYSAPQPFSPSAMYG